MDLTFVRHGATIWNAQRRFQGHTDVPLSNEGRTQARELACAFAGEPFDRIISSDLSRAYDTAVEIGRGRLSPQIDARWREFGFGRWEGLRVDEVEAGVNARAYTPPGGETFETVRLRVAEALEELRHSDLHSVLIVTHAGPLHAMLDVLFGEVPVVFAPASITQLRLGSVDAELLSLGISVRQYAEFKQANTEQS